MKGGRTFAVCATVAVAAAAAVPLLLLSGLRASVGPAVLISLIAAALAFLNHSALRGVTFSVWVFAFVAAALFYPAAFLTWFGRDLKALIVPLIQIIMFGMGTTLSLRDFTRVLAMPWPVCVGIVLQFSVMPLVGLTIATGLGFEPEVAAGVILIGSVPGGVASNLMTYLARGDVALSVTMTACSTLLSPILTPLLMKVLAGRFVPIVAWDLMVSILEMIVVPIVAGLIAHQILYSRERWAGRAVPLVVIAVVSAGVAAAAALVDNASGGWWLPSGLLPLVLSLRGGVAIGGALVAAVAVAKLIVNVLMRGPERWMDRVLPLVSMIGICFIIAIITTRSREQLLTVGLAIMAAAVMHNTAGYVLGYWAARLLRLSETVSRTVAIEVGLQNGGMASGLAINVLQSPAAALAPAIFGPWMNISGSILASWWHRRPVGDQTT
ncbi:MAG: bile acid:sodium symporter family protein [Pirellulaceae bacterium]|jgi:BASS family bile acid:Na+ symporter|nr:bile acid:sodium symporter family protein [Pirellulaceae bacterium]